MTIQYLPGEPDCAGSDGCFECGVVSQSWWNSGSCFRRRRLFRCVQFRHLHRIWLRSNEIIFFSDCVGNVRCHTLVAVRSGIPVTCVLPLLFILRRDNFFPYWRGRRGSAYRLIPGLCGCFTISEIALAVLITKRMPPVPTSDIGALRRSTTTIFAVALVKE